MKKNRNNHQSSIINHKSIRGFTLIELLIVIAIIGVLSTLLMANFIGVRQRARDAQRKSDIRQIQSALELYRSDNGIYPAPAAAGGDYPGGCGSGVKLQKAPTIYMGTVPCDPSGTSIGFNGGDYYYSSTTTTYTLASCIENTADTGQGVQGAPPPGASGVCPGGSSAKYFVVTQP